MGGEASKICDGLYLGSAESARNIEELKNLNVTHVLNVAQFYRPAHFPDLFEYLVIGALDVEEQDLRQYFERCFEFIDTAISGGSSCLVHCMAGVSRSATIVIAYLMVKREMTFGDALTMTKDARPCVSPNDGFVRQLVEFEREIFVKKHGEEYYYQHIAQASAKAVADQQNVLGLPPPPAQPSKVTEVEQAGDQEAPAPEASAQQHVDAESAILQEA